MRSWESGPNHSFLAPEADPESAARICDAIKSRKPVDTELVSYRGDGSPFWARIAIQPVKNKRGAIRGFICVEQDRSAFRRHTSALENEIARLYQILIEVAPALKADPL
jgi:PAS domain-containing protein